LHSHNINDHLEVDDELETELLMYETPDEVDDEMAE